MSVLFGTSYGLKYYTMIVVEDEIESLEDSEFWRKLQSLDPSDIAGQEYFYTVFYWLNDGNRIIPSSTNSAFLMKLFTISSQRSFLLVFIGPDQSF